MRRLTRCHKPDDFRKGYAHVGQDVFTLIDARTWVAIGNFREGQLSHIKPECVPRFTSYPSPMFDSRHRWTASALESLLIPMSSENWTKACRMCSERSTGYLASRYPVRVARGKSNARALSIGESAVVTDSWKLSMA